MIDENIRAQPPAREDAQPVAWVVRKGLSTGSLFYTERGQNADLPDGTLLYTTPPAPEAEKLLNALRDQSWDLRCFNIPTGGDDYDIGWRVIGHWQAEPCERTIAEVFSDDPAEAIRQALAPCKPNRGEK